MLNNFANHHANKSLGICATHGIEVVKNNKIVASTIHHNMTWALVQIFNRNDRNHCIL